MSKTILKTSEADSSSPKKAVSPLKVHPQNFFFFFFFSKVSNKLPAAPRLSCQVVHHYVMSSCIIKTWP